MDFCGELLNAGRFVLSRCPDQSGDNIDGDCHAVNHIKCIESFNQEVYHVASIYNEGMLLYKNLISGIIKGLTMFCATKIFRLSAIYFAITLSFCTHASCQTITLNETISLYKSKAVDDAYATTAKVNEVVIILDSDNLWVTLKYKDKKYYTLYDNIYGPHHKTVGSEDTMTVDSTCDFASPYSGSNVFFDRPFAKFRHNYPMGIIFGEHERSPC